MSSELKQILLITKVKCDTYLFNITFWPIFLIGLCPVLIRRYLPITPIEDFRMRYTISKFCVGPVIWEWFMIHPIQTMATLYSYCYVQHFKCRTSIEQKDHTCGLLFYRTGIKTCVTYFFPLPLNQEPEMATNCWIINWKCEWLFRQTHKIKDFLNTS
jgi:hypothetical protein